MTFAEAKEKLKEMAGGKYHSLRFELSGKDSYWTRITAYIEDVGHTPECRTYEMVLSAMSTMIRQQDNPQQIEEMFPE